jgi:hypothetical protein
MGFGAKGAEGDPKPQMFKLGSGAAIFLGIDAGDSLEADERAVS